MKRVLLILLVLLVTRPALAQEPGPARVYLPAIFGGDMATCENVWKIITPQPTTNYVLNPSAGGATYFAAAGGGTVIRSTDHARYGLYSFYLTTFASNDGLDLTLGALSAQAHYVTFRSYGELPANWRVLVRTQYRTPVLLEQIDRHWRLYGVPIPASEASGSTHLYVLERGEGGASRYLDGFQIEPHPFWTTYADGDRPGVKWNGTDHAATSTRSARSRAGGRVLDLAEDYQFIVEEAAGIGVGPVRLSSNDYALLPGSSLNSAKQQARVMTLTGTIYGTSVEDLHAKRQTLGLALDPSAYNKQPVLVRYFGAETAKEISCVYEGGLDISGMPVHYGPYLRDLLGGEWQEDYVYTERASIRFLCPNPIWSEIGETSAALDVNGTSSMKIVTARIDGEWQNFGPPAAGGGSIYTDVRAFAEDSNYVYLAGSFLNWDTVAVNDYLLRYDKAAGTFSALGTPANALVRVLVLDASGNLYAAGNFTSIGGVLANAVARWDGTNWHALGGGLTGGLGQVFGMTLGLDGTLYVTGDFNTAGGGAASRIAAWDSSTGTWSALGAGLNSYGLGLAIAPNGHLFVAGNFTAVAGGGITLNYVGEWNPDTSAWSALGSGFDNAGSAVVVRDDGLVYCAGYFTTAGGSSAAHVAQWNGTSWSPLGDGVNDTAFALHLSPDNLLFVGGQFTTAGGLSLANQAAIWNGSSWAHLPISLPGGPSVYAIHTGPADPEIPSNYDLWLGFTSTGDAYFSDVATVTNDGTTDAHPVVTFERTGGSAPATVTWLKNETTGAVIWLNYALLDGEQLILDFRPTHQSIKSSFFGPVPKAVLTPSETSQFVLTPGDNVLSAFVDFDVALYSAEISAWATWGTPYLSAD